MDLYDTIIVGGGIAGLYSAWLLHKKHPKQRFIILEKEGYVGGRILNYSDKYMNVEKGAARFNENHRLLISLIDSLGLSNHIVKISSDAYFYPSDGTGSPITDDYDIFINMIANPMKTILEMLITNSHNPIAPLIVRVVLHSKLLSKSDLINTTFISVARQTLSESDVQHIIDAFGFYTELVSMNAYDCIALMEGGLNTNNQFFVLRGGLSQITDALVKQLKPHISTNVEVASISYKKNHFEIKTEKKVYYSLNCITAIPKQNLMELKIFKPLLKQTKFIECHPLCRIYSKFDMSDKKNAWIYTIPKATTNNNLRIVIPIDSKSGVIMVSYSDNKFADFWKSLEAKSGIRGVNNEIVKLFRASFGIDIPHPISTKVFYWKCGVGYWGVGADSAAIEASLLRPFPEMPLYICGEHYSSQNQQWIEGALETSEKVVQMTASSSSDL
jgi:monoamine oxidase